MTTTLFKLMHGNKIHRIEPAPSFLEEKFDEIRGTVFSIVECECKLIWKDGQIEKPLDTVFDLTNAIENAKSAAKRSFQRPWVQLGIVETSAQLPTQPAAAVEATVHAAPAAATAAVKSEEMRSVEFKFMHGNKMHRFTPDLPSLDELFDYVRAHVSSIVDRPHNLIWNDGQFECNLRTSDDFSKAIEKAKSAAKGSSRPPWVKLEIVETSARLQTQPAAPSAAVEATIPAADAAGSAASAAPAAPVAYAAALKTTAPSLTATVADAVTTDHLAAGKYEEMTRIEFKFMHENKMNRFTPDLPSIDELFDYVRAHISSIVEHPHDLIWNDGQFDCNLHTSADFSKAIEKAKKSAKKSTRPPWVQLSVVEKPVLPTPTAAAVAKVDVAVFTDVAAAISFGGNGRLKFNLIYGADEIEFTLPPASEHELFYDLRAHVFSMVDQPSEVVKLIWNDGAMDHPLDYPEDLTNAINLEMIGTTDSSNSTPCLQLSVELTSASPSEAEAGSANSDSAYSDASTHSSDGSATGASISIPDEEKAHAQARVAHQIRGFKRKTKHVSTRGTSTNAKSTPTASKPKNYSNRYQALSEQHEKDGDWTGMSNPLDDDLDIDAIEAEFAMLESKETPAVHHGAAQEDHHSVAQEDHRSDQEQHRWLLPRNGGNDCFLNAALQYMRRAGDLREALKLRKTVDSKDEKEQAKECVLLMLAELLTGEGSVGVKEFRAALPKAIKGLEERFLTTQQDAYEILTKIFDDVIPEAIGKQFFIESERRRRCKDNQECKGSEQGCEGAIHYQHIGSKNQLINLESLLSNEWVTVEGDTEPRHCSSCCECCRAAEEGHDEDKCETCKGDKRPYVEEQRFRFKGTSDYALIAFNILHAEERVDWALEKKCDMDNMKLMGQQWKAVAVIKHIGQAGHYVAYTREEDGRWWLHDDDEIPRSIGKKYRVRSGYSYPMGTTDMQGVLAILFQKIE